MIDRLHSPETPLSNRNGTPLEMNPFHIFYYSHAVKGFSPFLIANHARQCP